MIVVFKNSDKNKISSKETAKISFKQIKKAFPYFNNFRLGVIEVLLKDSPFELISCNVVGVQDTFALVSYTMYALVNNVSEKICLNKLFAELLDEPALSECGNFLLPLGVDSNTVIKAILIVICEKILAEEVFSMTDNSDKPKRIIMA